MVFNICVCARSITERFLCRPTGKVCKFVCTIKRLYLGYRGQILAISNFISLRKLRESCWKVNYENTLLRVIPQNICDER